MAKGDTAGEFKTGPRGLARVTGGKGTATRTLALLSTIFNYAIQQRMRPDNPCRGVGAYAYQKRKRRLAQEEYAALGQALDDPPKVWPSGLNAIRFLAITGWRRGEVLNLTWAEIDLGNRTAHLQDTKTGQSMRPLSAQAGAILKAQPKAGDLVFPSPSNPQKPMGNFNKLWLKVRKRAILPADISPHIFRHSFGSEAGDLGYSELTIAALLGHKKLTVTAAYVHNADAVLLAAADAVASVIVAKMAGGAS